MSFPGLLRSISQSIINLKQDPRAPFPLAQDPEDELAALKIEHQQLKANFQVVSRVRFEAIEQIGVLGLENCNLRDENESLRCKVKRMEEEMNGMREEIEELNEEGEKTNDGLNEALRILRKHDIDELGSSTLKVVTTEAVVKEVGGAAGGGGEEGCVDLVADMHCGEES